jgi:hypothetical protein
MEFRSLCIIAAFALGLASCSLDVERTGEERACIARRHKSYDSKQLGQCVDVCATCMKGSAVICYTSCKLNGAR